MPVKCCGKGGTGRVSDEALALVRGGGRARAHDLVRFPVTALPLWFLLAFLNFKIKK